MQTKVIETIKSLLVAYALTILLLLLVALGVYLWNWNTGMVNLIIIFTYIITCFLGGFRLGRKMQTRRFIWGLLLGFCYILLLVLASLIVNHGVNLASSTNLTAIFLCLVSGMLGGMVS